MDAAGLCLLKSCRDEGGICRTVILTGHANLPVTIVTPARRRAPLAMAGINSRLYSGGINGK